MLSHCEISDINSAFDNALDWIFDNQIFLFSEESQVNESAIAELKPIGEFFLVANLLRKCGVIDQRFKQAMDEIWGRLDLGDFVQQILLTRPDIVALATIYSDMADLGYRHLGVDNFLLHYLNTAAINSIELPAWRLLDVQRARAKLLKMPLEFDISTCWFWNCPEPWVVSDDVMYALTHDVFYLTEFGQIGERIPKKHRDYLTECLPAWIELHAENLDIKAELGMVAAYIGEFVLAREVALSIIEAQWESGIIPSPPGAGASLRRSIKLKNEKHAQFLENYHTTFVSVIFLGQIRAMCAPGT